MLCEHNFVTNVIVSESDKDTASLSTMGKSKKMRLSLESEAVAVTVYMLQIPLLARSSRVCERGEHVCAVMYIPA